MVRIRLMTTSPGHQESGNASSDPNCALAPLMTVQQELQSMATAMVELTQQN